MREWSDEVRSGMTTSSSVRLAGRDSPRDDRGRDVKLAGILSLSSLELRKTLHVAIVVFHFDFYDSTVGFERANFAVTTGVRAYETVVIGVEAVYGCRQGREGGSEALVEIVDNSEGRKAASRSDGAGNECRTRGKEKAVQGKGREDEFIDGRIAYYRQSRVRNPLTYYCKVKTSYSAPLELIAA